MILQWLGSGKTLSIPFGCFSLDHLTALCYRGSHKPTFDPGLTSSGEKIIVFANIEERLKSCNRS